MANLCVKQLCKPGLSRIEPSPMNNVERKKRGPDSGARGPQKACLKENVLDCIGSLSFKGITSRRNNISLSHKGTCKWLFKAPSFMKWKDHADLKSNNGVLWIKGHPGVGKSTLMKHILLHCEEKFKDHNIAFYFFNARGGPLEKSPLGMLRSLMAQLLDRDPFMQQQFIPHFLMKIRLGERVWETGELKDFLLREYTKHQCKYTLLLDALDESNDSDAQGVVDFRGTLLPIDALDECNDSDVQEVVNFLEYLSENAIQSNSNLRICLSSRHYPHIDMEKKIELVVEQQDEHDEDIIMYVQSKLKAKDKDIHERILDKV